MASQSTRKKVSPGKKATKKITVKKTTGKKTGKKQPAKKSFEVDVNRKAFVSILGELVNALGKGSMGVEFPLGKKKIGISARSLKNATFEVELENEDDEYELELSIGWKK